MTENEKDCSRTTENSPTPDNSTEIISQSEAFVNTIYEIPYNNHEEWLSIRKQYIGGSDAAAIVGLDDYNSPYSVWAEKTGKTPGFEGNITTKVGAYLEDLVAQMFTEESGKKVRRKNFTVVNNAYPFACANLDRVVVGEKALLECKTTNSLPAMRKCRNGEYPERWYCQMTHYLAVTGYDRAYLAVLIGCREFKVFVLERDEDEIKALMDAEKVFWSHVEDNTPPAVDGKEATTETLTALYPESNGESVSLYAYESSLKEYMALTAQIKALEALKDEAANSVKAFMSEAGRGESANYKVSWTSAVRNSFDSKKYLKDHGDNALDGYYKQSSYRTFKVTEIERG